jgi:putative iron-dependent peroxidase
MAEMNWGRVPIDAQSVDAPLSRSAIFLTVSVDSSAEDLTRAREAIAGVDDLVKTVGFRDLGGHLSCVVGIGSTFWDRLSPHARPVELHPFERIDGAHTAPSTEGDLLFHIRAERADMCFELERLILLSLGGSVSVIDEVSGFRYFDARDLLGFVDGTANPMAADILSSALIGDDDPDFMGGSYVVVQKYVHDLDTWTSLSTEEQERIIGRTKFDNVELDSATEERPSHKSLATIDDGAGGEFDILRDNMPFGRPGRAEFGTYFIGYSGRLWVTERMLQRMFMGEPAGSYDRILDFSTAVTGVVFFAPSRELLGSLSDPIAMSGAVSGDGATEVSSVPESSLGLGSLRAE